MAKDHFRTHVIIFCFPTTAVVLAAVPEPCFRAQSVSILECMECNQGKPGTMFAIWRANGGGKPLRWMTFTTSQHRYNIVCFLFNSMCLHHFPFSGFLTMDNVTRDLRLFSKRSIKHYHLLHHDTCRHSRRGDGFSDCRNKTINVYINIKQHLSLIHI